MLRKIRHEGDPTPKLPYDRNVPSTLRCGCTYTLDGAMSLLDEPEYGSVRFILTPCGSHYYAWQGAGVEVGVHVVSCARSRPDSAVATGKARIMRGREWKDALCRLLPRAPDTFIATYEIMRAVGFTDKEKADQKSAILLADVMRSLGWKAAVSNVGNSVVPGYARAAAPANDVLAELL